MLSFGDKETTAVHHTGSLTEAKDSHRNPAIGLAGCNRIVIIGRTGSGKTTLARELAAVLGVPHVELDSLYFEPDFSTVSLEVLRERTREAIAGDRWVTDGNKSAVRDLVWPGQTQSSGSIIHWQSASGDLVNARCGAHPFLEKKLKNQGKRKISSVSYFRRPEGCLRHCARIRISGRNIHYSSPNQKTSTWWLKGCVHRS